MAQVLSRLDRGPAKREEGSVCFPGSGSGPGAQREKPGKAGVGHPSCSPPWAAGVGWGSSLVDFPLLPAWCHLCSQQELGVGAPWAWLVCLGVGNSISGFPCISEAPLSLWGHWWSPPEVSYLYITGQIPVMPCPSLQPASVSTALNRNSFQEFWPVDGVFLQFLVQISLLPIRS